MLYRVVGIVTSKTLLINAVLNVIQNITIIDMCSIPESVSDVAAVAG